MCFEPNEETNISNSKATKINITNVLWNDETQIKFHIAKEKSQSSVHPPNIDLIKKFSEFFSYLDDKPICKILNVQIPYLYVNKIEDINAILGQQQLENILSTLHILDNNKPDKLDTIKKNNILKCIQYCIKNKLPYNKNIIQHNMFIAT